MEPKKDIVSVSIISVLWWVVLWFLFEEIILLVSGNKRHLKVLICITIAALIYMYVIINPTHVESL